MNELNLDKELFTPLTDEEKKVDVVVRPSISYWKDAWMRLKSNKVALASLCVVVLIILSAIIVPMCSQYDYSTNDLSATNLKPSSEHLF